MEIAKLIIEVVAGLIPSQPIPEHTRRWVWTSGDQVALKEGASTAKEKWIRIHGESREYAATLEDPSKINWVRRDWIWM